MHYGATAGNLAWGPLSICCQLLSSAIFHALFTHIWIGLSDQLSQAKDRDYDCDWLPLATGTATATATFSTPTEIAVNQCSMLIDNHVRVL